MTMRDIETYIKSICARQRFGEEVPLRPVAGDGGSPKERDCHNNVDRYVREHPGTAAVRGWIVDYVSPGVSTTYTAHSVVRSADDRSLFDITPLPENEMQRGNFIRHPGDDDAFFWMESQARRITCPDEPTQDDTGKGEEVAGLGEMLALAVLSGFAVLVTIRVAAAVFQQQNASRPLRRIIWL
jgi:hypothetical protein